MSCRPGSRAAGPDADVFLALRQEFGDFLLPEQARRELAVGPTIMAQLEEAGLIRRLPPTERVLEIKPFRKSEIAAFVAACRGKAKPITAEAAAKLSTLISPTAPGRTVPDICHALMDGRLKADGIVRGKKGLSAIRLSLDAVEAALPSTKATLSLLDAAKRIGLKYPPVHFWVKRGLLAATTSDGVDEHGMRVTHEEWQRFVGEYATSGMLADEIGQGNNTWIARHLSFLSVKPISGKEIDGGYTNLFRRTDVGPGVIKEIRRIQQGAPGTPQDKHRGSFARVATVAAGIAVLWGIKFTRTHNPFMDRATGRAVRMVSGRRPDITGVFVFHTRSQSLASLEATADPWVDYKLATAASIEKLWGVKLDRHRSLFTEIGGRRMVQVVPGKTEGASIRQTFTLQKAAYDRLAECSGAWIALLPKGHAGFTLVPFGSLPWRPYGDITVQASVKIDAEEKPMGLDNHAR